MLLSRTADLNAGSCMKLQVLMPVCMGSGAENARRQAGFRSVA